APATAYMPEPKGGALAQNDDDGPPSLSGDPRDAKPAPKRGDAGVNLASMPSATREDSGEPKTAAPPKPGGANTVEWAELDRRMKTLGVSRYGVEGQIGGAVRFRCVVPLAGTSAAVSQQFEAEADDPKAAADAALRRVALWKATESK